MPDNVADRLAAGSRKEIREESAAEEVKPDPQERLTLAVERLAEVMESK